MGDQARERAPRLRARVREALVCPYCRDAVTRRGTVACARRACGALYHRECWDECAQNYGGCAVFGCESRKSREVSVAGYFLRLARLFVAAILFPPRLVQAIRSEQRSEERKSILKRSLAYARLLDPRTASGLYAAFCFLLYLGGLAGVLYGLVAILLLDWSFLGGVAPYLGFVLCVVCVFVAVFSPVPLGFLLALAFYFMKFVGHVFRSELGALGRVDQGGTTVLGRLRAGAGKKECHEH